MAFKLNIEKPSKAPSGSDHGGNASKVDYDALNEHLVKQAGTSQTKARSIPGYISGIVDLGIQPQEDYEGPLDPSASYPENAEFFTGDDGKKMVRFARRPTQQVALTVDFPQIEVDYGKFYDGVSNPVPYRFLLNGEFSEKVGDRYERIVGKGFSLVERRHPDGTWALAKNSTLHKLAQACDLLDSGGYFKASRVGELLGKAAQFQIKVCLVERNTRKYLNENISLAGIIPEGVAFPPLPESYLYGVNMNGENDPVAVSRLRTSIKNTLRRATNYAGSSLQSLLEGGASLSGEKPQPAPAKVEDSKPTPPPVADFVDDTNPWDD